MTLFRLAFANLIYRKVNAFISVILLVFGVALISILLNASRFLDTNLVNSIQDVDMVVGAKGSPLQLILANIYHIDNPTGNISLKQVDGMLRNPLIEKSVKLSYGDYYSKYRILGASPSIYSFYSLSCAQGKLGVVPMDVVIGDGVAQETGWKIGQQFESAHGEGEGEKHQSKFTVVGILKPSGTSIDGLIVTSLESIWEVHEPLGSNSQPAEITAVLVKFKSPMGLLTVPAMINKNTSLMAAIPAIEVSRLLSIFEDAFQILYYLSLVIIFIALLSVFFSLLNSLQERKYELALLRLQGASRWQLFQLITLEGTIISSLGSIVGLIVGRVAFVALTVKFGGGIMPSLNIVGLGPDLWLVPASIFIGIMAALLPALSAYRVSITDLLKEK